MAAWNDLSAAIIFLQWLILRTFGNSEYCLFIEISTEPNPEMFITEIMISLTNARKAHKRHG